MQARCGRVAIMGRPNVGKSSLLNRLLGKRLSIVTHKAQTTRHNLLGILNVSGGQILLLDTPGIHQGRRAINRHMNRAARGLLPDVDAAVFMLDANAGIRREDEQVLRALDGFDGPVIAVLNKVDRLTNKQDLLPLMETLAKRRDFHAILPVSARTGDGVEPLPDVLLGCLPESDPWYRPEQLTDADDQFQAAEMIREQLLRCLHEEIPYRLAVTIEEFKRRSSGALLVGAIIWVERKTLKGMVIGKGGQTLKLVGQRAREAMEVYFECPVHLDLWVKQKADWTDDEQAMRELGFGE